MCLSPDDYFDAIGCQLLDSWVGSCIADGGNFPPLRSYDCNVADRVNSVVGVAGIVDIGIGSYTQLAGCWCYGAGLGLHGAVVDFSFGK